MKDTVDQRRVAYVDHLERLETGPVEHLRLQEGPHRVAAVKHTALVWQAVDPLPLDVLGQQAEQALVVLAVEGLDPGLDQFVHPPLRHGGSVST